MSDRPRMSTTVWMAAGAVLLLLYPLSAGPVIWCAQTWQGQMGPIPEWVGYGIEGFYFPITLLMEYGPPWLKAPFEFYFRLWNV